MEKKKLFQVIAVDYETHFVNTFESADPEKARKAAYSLYKQRYCDAKEDDSLDFGEEFVEFEQFFPENDRSEVDIVYKDYAPVEFIWNEIEVE